MVRVFPTMIRKAMKPQQVAQKGFHLLKSILSKTTKPQLKILKLNDMRLSSVCMFLESFKISDVLGKLSNHDNEVKNLHN